VLKSAAKQDQLIRVQYESWPKSAIFTVILHHFGRRNLADCYLLFIFIIVAQVPSKREIKVARWVSGVHRQSRTNFDTRTEGWSRV
jgi:hypothetical protein